MILWGRSSDVRGERIWHVALPMLLAASGFAVASLAQSDLLVLTDPMGVDSDRRSDRVRLQTSHSGDEHASYSRSTRSAERYP